MRFALPEMLWMLLPLALLPLAAGRRAARASIQFPSVELTRAVAARRQTRSFGWLQALRLLALALLVVALARPQLGLGSRTIDAEGIDIVLAIDISGSMRALDFELDGKPANRLAVVKKAVRQFIDARTNDRLALVVFAQRPYLVSPLTLDHSWLQENLDRVELGMVEDGTAIGSAIASGTNRLRDRKTRSRVMVLLTDGVNNAGKVSPLTAADAARALGIRLYTIGAGTRGQAPIPVQDRFGRQRVVMAEVDVDEETLTSAAEATGGKYFRATDTESLEAIYEEIDQLETTEETLDQFEQWDDLFRWPLLAAVLLLAIERILGETRLRRLP